MELKVVGRVDQRPRDNTDVEYFPLPYEQTIISTTITNLASGANTTVSFTETDWGADLDYYISGLIFLFQASGNYSTKKGPFVRVQVNSGEMIFMMSMNAEEPFESIEPVNNDTRFSRPFANLRKVLDSETIDVYVENFTALNFSNIELDIQGIAI